MKTKNLMERLLDRSRVIARFGSAKLVQSLAGRYELVGGTSEDRLAAREWASLFLHEAVIADRER